MTATKTTIKVKFSYGWRQYIIIRRLGKMWVRFGCVLFPSDSIAQQTAECLANLYPELYELEAENGS
jgi:hypothetical protein